MTGRKKYKVVLTAFNIIAMMSEGTYPFRVKSNVNRAMRNERHLLWDRIYPKVSLFVYIILKQKAEEEIYFAEQTEGPWMDMNPAFCVLK